MRPKSRRSWIKQSIPDLNLATEFLDRNPRPKTAILTPGKTFTYGEVAVMANRAGNSLLAMGVSPGDRVLLLLPDGPEFVAAWFGAIKMGAVAVPTNTSLRTADYAHFFEKSQAAVALCHASLYPQIAPVTGAAMVIVTGEPVPGCVFWDDWIGAQPATLDAADTADDDIAFWLWTSGSTGKPKVAAHRHSDWLHCCEGYARGILDIGAADVTFSTAKLFHAYGLGNGLMFPFYAGATTALWPVRPQARAVLDFAQQVRPTLFFSVPTLYAAMLHETDAANPYDLSSVRLAVSAAEPLAADLYRRWHDRFGSRILDGIGSTEALHIYVSPRPDAVKPGSTGLPVPGYDIRITDEKGKPVEPGTVGDMWVRGASIAPGQADPEGWFFTGDKYSADKDGHLWYAGRSDDMFRVLGEWVSPIEVEAALIEHPAVLECAVVAYKDENQLSKPKACVVLKDQNGAGDEMAAELQQFVRQRIASYKYPRRIEFHAELPKTPTGKIQRYKLRDPWPAASAADPGA
jgi:benzoate-CoA ligase family protein